MDKKGIFLEDINITLFIIITEVWQDKKNKHFILTF